MSRLVWKPFTIRDLLKEESGFIVVVDPKNRTYSGQWSGSGNGRITLTNGYTETSLPTGFEGWRFIALPDPRPEFKVQNQPPLLP